MSNQGIHRLISPRANSARAKKRAGSKEGLHPSRLSGRSRRRGAVVSAAGNDLPHFLNPTFAPIKLHIRRDGSLFDGDCYPQHYIHIVVGNLYRMLKHMPGFVDNKVWTKMPTLPELADYLIDEIKKIHGDAYMYGCVDNGDGFKGLPRFFTYREIPKLDNTHNVPLEWLPMLEQNISPVLFQMLLSLIGKLSTGYHLDVLYGQYGSMLLDDEESNTDSEDEETAFEIKNDCRKYRKGGVAFDFQATIKKSAKEFSTESLVKTIKRFKPKKPADKQVHEWLLLGVPALQNPVAVGKYFFPDSITENGQEYVDAINANDMYAFPWSFHDSVHRYTENWYENLANEAPVVGPTIRTEYFTDKAPVALPPEEPIQALTKFMDRGLDIYFKEYHDKLTMFYKKESDLLIRILT